jgi:hypothetical protein
MRAPHWIAVTIVALCAGLGAGYLLFHNDPPPRLATAPKSWERAHTGPDQKPP